MVLKFLKSGNFGVKRSVGALLFLFFCLHTGDLLSLLIIDDSRQPIPKDRCADSVTEILRHSTVISSKK